MVTEETPESIATMVAQTLWFANARQADHPLERGSDHYLSDGEPEDTEVSDALATTPCICDHTYGEPGAERNLHAGFPTLPTRGKRQIPDAR
jgi:hypothetical protein